MFFDKASASFFIPILYDSRTSSSAARHSPTAPPLFPSTKRASLTKLRYCFSTLARCMKSPSDGTPPSSSMALRRVRLRTRCRCRVDLSSSSGARECGTVPLSLLAAAACASYLVLAPSPSSLFAAEDKASPPPRRAVRPANRSADADGAEQRDRLDRRSAMGGSCGRRRRRHAQQTTNAKRSNRK